MTLHAPFAGTIIERRVTTGERVYTKPGTRKSLADAFRQRRDGK
jgi:hypothetical protein